mmetsp:Transcript_26446/g.47459  ORF Transcript_26446/g.47459 Transcript_26446/m.47459 type:complete len:741 (+) Transcript_26446:36-2258(+)
MGVPTFFKWLTVRYPKVVTSASEESVERELPAFDNFYLDMNGIIHPCCHPQEGPQPRSEEEMFSAMFKYIDSLMEIIRPRQLLYLAIDGVAPRAKMNQQRARRFRKVQEERENQVRNAKHEAELRAQGLRMPEKEEGYQFDSNVITPGTPFMARLAAALHNYIERRLKKKWRNIEVILSDSNVPGEGEHKILEFIRQQRGLPGYNPNTKHCICGADADLIMLGLITHEPHFYIIRESLIETTASACSLCGMSGHFASECRGVKATKLLSRDKFQILRIPVLREYLYFEFEELSKMPWFDFERVIDDFVFICFFVGNDFLPHLPSLHIRDGAVDGLIFLYKRCFPVIRGYMTENGNVDFMRVNALLTELSKAEDEFFKNKLAREAPVAPRKRKHGETTEVEKNLEAARKLQRELEDEMVDTVRLGEEGWKLRYYHQKFMVGQDDLDEFRRLIQSSYLQGLCWVFSYYFCGVQSWGWYYPFHYAPFASDLINPTGLVISFNYGRPFNPIDQLMAVFPPESIGVLPTCMHSLALDPDSPIADFYPRDFKLDVNGKRFLWQGVMLLPFIEEERLLAAIQSRTHLLNTEELERNSPGETLIYSNKPTSSVLMLRKPQPPKFSRYHASSDIMVRPVEAFPGLKHQSALLQGCVEPSPRIDRHLFSCGDRRGFGAHQFISLISRYLMDAAPAIPADPYTRFSRSYNNNRAVCEEPRPVRRPEAPSSGSLIENLQKLVMLLNPSKPKS